MIQGRDHQIESAIVEKHQTMNGFVQVVSRQRRLQTLSLYYQAASWGNILVYQVHPENELVASPSSPLAPIALL